MAAPVSVGRSTTGGYSQSTQAWNPCALQPYRAETGTVTRLKLPAATLKAQTGYYPATWLVQGGHRSRGGQVSLRQKSTLRPHTQQRRLVLAVRWGKVLRRLRHPERAELH